MADGRHIAKCWKRYNSPINEPILMKLGWSHPIMSLTCPARRGCHGNGRCLATVHCTFSSYSAFSSTFSSSRTREPIWLKFGIQQHIRTTMTATDQILKFLKFKLADGRHVGKYSKCRNSPTNEPTGTQLGCSHPIMFPTCPPCCGCHGNSRCLATAH